MSTDDFQREDFAVPEWGFVVSARALSVDESENFQKTGSIDGDRQGGYVEACKIIVACCDVFRNISDLRRFDNRGIDYLMHQILRYSGFDVDLADDEELDAETANLLSEAEGNFAKTQSSDSSSG